jgi:hypothetical protein
MVAGGRGRYVLAGVLIGALAGGPRGPVFAGEDSSKGSNGSDNSSNSSGDSSNSSGDSSENSGDSSNRSENSTEASPQESTEGTTDESSDGSSNRRETVLVSVALLLASVGATVVGLVRASDAMAQADQPAKLRQLARFLQRNHALCARDVVVGEGPLLAAWTRALKLTGPERDHLSRVLDGSREQAELLAAIDGRIDEARARRFAVAFTQVGRRALGDARLRALVLAARR